MCCGRARPTIASAWGAAAATFTTVGQERAILRLFGVTGVDRAGRPLAAEVVDRYLAPDPRRLGGGIALPFAIAMAEYDLRPQELAMEVAAGNVDLGLEAELLAEPDRRAVAVANAVALARSALERVDANRVARRELLELLGDAPRPWIGVSLGVARDRGRAGRGRAARSMPVRSWSGSRCRPAASSRSSGARPGTPSTPGGPPLRHVAASTTHEPARPADPDRRPARALGPAAVRR